jgi:hypothetical protein
MSSSPARARARQTQAIKIGSDYSSARARYYWSYWYDLKNGGPVSQQVWHIKVPSIVMVIALDSWNIARAAKNNKKTHK